MLFGAGPSRFAYNSDTYTYSSRTGKWKLIICGTDGTDDGDEDDDKDDKQRRSRRDHQRE